MAAPTNGTTLDDIYEQLEAVEAAAGASSGATEAQQQTQTTHLAAIEAALEGTDPAAVVGVLGKVTVTPTVEATPDYSSGDVIGGKNTIAAIARADAGTGYITAVRIACKAANTAQIDVLFFRADPSNTTWTENAAVAVNASDLTNLLGFVEVDNWCALGTPSVGYKECRIPVTGLAADDIYMCMIARGTINLASTSDLIVEVTMDQN